MDAEFERVMRESMFLKNKFKGSRKDFEKKLEEKFHVMDKGNFGSMFTYFNSSVEIIGCYDVDAEYGLYA